MSTAERNIISVFLAAAVVISFFFIGWWAAAALSQYHLLSISDSGIGLAALCGAVVGIVVNSIYLKRWRANFYLAPSMLAMLVYLFWSAIAMALFMGLPLGNILLGMLAGCYYGRQQHHLGAAGETLHASARRVGLFTAAVTGLEMLPIGILGLREGSVQRILHSAIGLAPTSTMGLAGIALVVVLCFVLMGVQFWLTRRVALFSFRGGQGRPSS